MAYGIVRVGPSDNGLIDPLPKDIEGFVPNATGTVKVQTGMGETVQIAVTIGQFYPIAIRRFYNTGTTTVTAIDLYYGKSPV